MCEHTSHEIHDIKNILLPAAVGLLHRLSLVTKSLLYEE